MHKNELGRIIREAWVAQAQEQSAPKPSWLSIPWEELSEFDHEAYRRVGEAVAVAMRDECANVALSAQRCFHVLMNKATSFGGGATLQAVDAYSWCAIACQEIAEAIAHCGADPEEVDA